MAGGSREVAEAGFYRASRAIRETVLGADDPKTQTMRRTLKTWLAISCAMKIIKR
jgi:hypothetical protein